MINRAVSTTQPWDWASFKAVRVHTDCCIEFDRHRCSVLHALVGLALELRITAQALEVLYRGEWVVSQMRCALPIGRCGNRDAATRLAHSTQDAGGVEGEFFCRLAGFATGLDNLGPIIC